MANTATSQADSAKRQHTPLWRLHTKLGAKMVAFAGFDMPVQYDGFGVLKEHLHTRSQSGLFDVSHMGQALLSCPNDDPARHLETLVPSSLTPLKPGKMRYTVLLNEQGTILDDLMVTRIDENTLYIVVNAACKTQDFDLLQNKLKNKVKLTLLKDHALIALQGPKAVDVICRLNNAVNDMTFMTMQELTLLGSPCYISRSGYTGEDGVEISIPADKAIEIAEALLSYDEVKAIGLGARDSLRLEAGLCLYGHDINQNTTPIEANLHWVIQKRRREEANFPGADLILDQLKNGVSKKRVGLQPDGRAPVREGVEIVDENDIVIGVVTSGTFGPTVEKPIAMAYVKTGFETTGTKVFAKVRNRRIECTVSDLPFIQPNYKR